MSGVRPAWDSPGAVEVVRVLRAAIDGKALSVRAAAKQANVSYSALGAWLRGSRNPTAAAMVEFLWALGYPQARVSLDSDEDAEVDAVLGRAVRFLGWTPPGGAQ